LPVAKKIPASEDAGYKNRDPNGWMPTKLDGLKNLQEAVAAMPPRLPLFLGVCNFAFKTLPAIAITIGQEVSTR